MGKNTNSYMKKKGQDNFITDGKRTNKFAALYDMLDDSDEDSNDSHSKEQVSTITSQTKHKQSVSKKNKNVTLVAEPASPCSEVAVAKRVEQINKNPEKHHTVQEYNTVQEQSSQPVTNTGKYMLLPSIWHLWEHKSDNKDWKIDSYNKIMAINNVSDLWGLLNNFYKLDHKMYDFFLMKEDILPIWEHKKNRDGSTCSIRTDTSNGTDALSLLILHMVTNKLYTDGTDDINGISCSVRNNWMVIKVWCGFKEDKLSNILQGGVLGRLSNLSIRHISTIPQY